MTHLKLAPDAPTPVEKLLLDASRAEQPSLEHKARLRAALGIEAALSGSLAAAPTAHVNVGAPAANGGGKSMALAKAGLGIALAAVVGAFLWNRPAPNPSTPPSRPAPVAETSKPLPEPAPVVAAAPAVAPSPSNDVPSTPVRASRPDASAASADLSAQIRLIEAARAGVAAHEPRAALAALDGYAKKFPLGSLGQEALVLRIRALDQAGDSARATALAQSFVARFPNSPHVPRLQPIAERGASR